MHLITDEVIKLLPEISSIKVGLLHLFLQHTSAGLTVNENADPTVRDDFNKYINRLVPEGLDYFVHTYEGPDDMPAHIKSSLMGCNVTLPLKDGRLNLGVWQGIYLGEFRNNGGSRQIVATING